jgi:hypothetical protein
VTAIFRQDGIEYGAQGGTLQIEALSEDQRVTGTFQFTAADFSEPPREIQVKGWFREIPLYPPPIPFGQSRESEGKTP